MWSPWHSSWFHLSLALLKMLSGSEQSKVKAAKAHWETCEYLWQRLCHAVPCPIPPQILQFRFLISPMPGHIKESFLSIQPCWKPINHLIIKARSFQEKIQARAETWVSSHLHSVCSLRENGIWAALHYGHLAAELPSSYHFLWAVSTNLLCAV